MLTMLHLKIYLALTEGSGKIKQDRIILLFARLLFPCPWLFWMNSLAGSAISFFFLLIAPIFVHGVFDRVQFDLCCLGYSSAASQDVIVLLHKHTRIAAQTHQEL